MRTPGAASASAMSLLERRDAAHAHAGGQVHLEQRHRGPGHPAHDLGHDGEALRASPAGRPPSRVSSASRGLDPSWPTCWWRACPSAAARSHPPGGVWRAAWPRTTPWERGPASRRRPSARAPPSLRVSGCSHGVGRIEAVRARPPMTWVSSEDEARFGLPFASSPDAASPPRRPFLARGSTLVGAAASPAVSGTKPPASPALLHAGVGAAASAPPRSCLGLGALVLHALDEASRAKTR